MFKLMCTFFNFLLKSIIDLNILFYIPFQIHDMCFTCVGIVNMSAFFFLIFNNVIDFIIDRLYMCYDTIQFWAKSLAISIYLGRKRINLLFISLSLFFLLLCNISISLFSWSSNFSSMLLMSSSVEAWGDWNFLIFTFYIPKIDHGKTLIDPLLSFQKQLQHVASLLFIFSYMLYFKFF